MSDDVFSKHKLSDAIDPAATAADPAHPNAKSGMTPATSAEQQREQQEGQHAHEHPVTPRERLIDIGRASHAGGRADGSHGHS